MLTKGELDQVANIPLMDESLRLEQESVEGNPSVRRGRGLPIVVFFGSMRWLICGSIPKFITRG